MHLDIVSDVICPWCYIGKRRLERALARRPGLVITRSWRAFQLNPDLPIEGIPHGLYLAAKFGNSLNARRACAALCAVGREEGIEFAFDRIGRTPNTLRAHRLIRFAAGEGAGDTIVEALFRAYFLEGLDIGNIDTLAAIAGRNGLPSTAVRSYLIGEAGSQDVREEDHRARHLGIHAVPCFVLERNYAISGAQEPEMLLSLFDFASGVGNAAGAETSTPEASPRRRIDGPAAHA
jgi:predicted DsbA family dithiol-disulfide isomerase